MNVTAVLFSAMGNSGRPRGRDLSELELKHLRTLLDIRENAQTTGAVYDAKLEDFVAELHDGGCSLRGIADAARVSHGTVKLWTDHAKQRRA